MSEQLSLSQFTTLKDQAKQLLLKGCYKMAANKYKILLQQAPSSLSPRELSILSLNQAICYQSLNNLQKCLTLINQAITLDPSYQKSYYRKIQVCKELKKFEEIVTGVPGWVRNKEIDLLMEEVKQEYARYLEEGEVEGVEREVRRGVQSGEVQKVEQINRALIKRYREKNGDKIREQLETGLFRKYFDMIRDKKGENQGKQLQMYYDTIYYIVKDLTENHLSQNWWSQRITPILSHSQYLPKVMRLCPYFTLSLPYNQLQESLKKVNPVYLKQSIQTLLILLNTESKSMDLSKHKESQQIVKFLCDTIQNSLKKLQNTVQFELIWSTLILLLPSQAFNKQFTLPQPQTFKELCILLFNITQQCQQSESEYIQMETQNVQELVQHIVSNHFNVPYLYLLNDILNRLKFKPDQFSQKLKQFFLNTNLKPQQTQLTLQLLTRLITSKIDHILISSPQLQQLFSLSFPTLSPSTQSLFLQLLSTLSLLNRSHLLHLLTSNKTLFPLLTTISSNPSHFSKLRTKAAIINILYLICVDISEEKNQIAAEKLGVTVEEVVQAKKLQDPKEKGKLEEEIKDRRRMLLNIKIQLFKSTITPFLTPSTQLLSLKLSHILSSLSKINPKLFLSPIYIQYMLSLTSSLPHFSFFSTITKDSNPQIFLLKHKQPIINILQDGLQKSGHELVIFECLLGILNIMGEGDVHVDVRKVLGVMYEENQYIVHGWMNVLNNCLVKGESNYQKLRENDIEGIMVYYRHYSALQSQPQSSNTNDYSHPHRIYLTLLSLLMVLSSYKPLSPPFQLTSLTQLITSLQHIDIKWKSQVIGKALMYFTNKGQTINKQTIGKVQKELEYIKMTNQGFYSQLKRLLL